MADSTAEVFSAAKFTQRASICGLTWKDLAAELGVHRTTLGAIRSGRSAPSTELLMKIVEVLGGEPTDYLDLPDRQVWGLKLYRTVAGFTQQAVAEALAVAQTAVSGWETGRYNPPRSLLPKLAEMYGVTVAELEAATALQQEITASEVLVSVAEAVASFAEVACDATTSMPSSKNVVSRQRLRAQLESSLETLGAAIRDLPDDDTRDKVIDVVRRLAELHSTTIR